jgi:hypothetical protein
MGFSDTGCKSVEKKNKNPPGHQAGFRASARDGIINGLPARRDCCLAQATVEPAKPQFPMMYNFMRVP